MEKASGKNPPERGTSIGREIPESHRSKTLGFFHHQQTVAIIPANCQQKDFYSRLFQGILRVQHLERGQLTCLVSVKPAVVNAYGGLHGGAVAIIVELVSIACARTVVAEDKQLFLGELSTSYLSAAPPNAEIMVTASVVRTGRNVTVIAVEFKMNKTGKLCYTGRATFYNMPTAKL